jgi:predicted Zn-ribbon and HTH transcriptional regulator
MYNIVEREGRGKVVVAAVDLLPGVLVMEEGPLFLFPTPSIMIWGKTMMEACYLAFTQNVTPENKALYNELYWPGFENAQTRNFRDLLLESGGYTLEHADEVIRVFSIFRVNAFGIEDGKMAGVFNIITRMSHSCENNCHSYPVGQNYLCRVTRPIRAGEELTITYNAERNLEPTHQRRYMYAQSKDFTCHCRRCDALGDDTRVFPCFDAKCKGSHLVRQPLSSQPLLIEGITYDGTVEYVEPHLLPCTACQRTPPAQYQSDMLALETRLPAIAETVRAKRAALDGPVKDPATWMRLYREIEEMRIPPGHVDSLPILKDVQHILMFANMRLRNPVPAIEAAERVAAVYDRVLGVHNAQTQSFYGQFCTNMAFAHGDNAACVRKVREFMQRTVRTYAILQGRENRYDKYDECLLKILELQQRHGDRAVVDAEVCGFCGESPERAAMKRSRCGACKAVMYCSVGCQKAHWKLHKHQCKKA